MRNKEKKTPKLNSKDYILSSDAEAILYGLILVLISLIGLLNNGVVGEALTYIFAYLFGVFYILVYLILIFFGLYLMIKKSVYKLKIDLKILGVILLLVGFCVASSMGHNLTISTFFSSYQNQVSNSQKYVFAMLSSDAIYANLGGGIVGYFLTGALNSALTEIGTAIVVFILVIVGLILLFKDLIIRFVKWLIAYHKKRKEIRMNSHQVEGSHPIASQMNVNKSTEETPEIIEPIKKKEVETISFDSMFEKPKRETASDILTDLSNEEKNDFFYKKEVSPKVEETKEEIQPESSTNNQNQQNDIGTTQNTSVSNSSFVSMDRKEEVKIKENKPIIFTSYEEDEEEDEEELPRQTFTPVESIIDNNSYVNNTPLNKEVNVVETKPSINNKVEIKKELSSETKANVKNDLSNYQMPSLELLKDRVNKDESTRKNAVAQIRMGKINECFSDLGIGASVISYTIGPSVTRFDVKVNSNVKTNVLCSIENDLAVRLGGNKTVRLETIVEGRDTSGIEVGNDICDMVSFKECMKAIESNKDDRLLFPLGKDISGNVVSCCLDEMPHLLVCGTTGSGKSVFIHNIICSLIMRNKPDQLKLMLIDPKRIEFTKYHDLPHLLCPVITSTERGKVGLMKLVDEMERRYDLFAEKGRGASNYKEYMETCEEMGYEKIPYIVMICDEFADFMSDGDKEVAKLIQRIAQKARACGIYMVIATQRPSAKVITGEIKANIPSRIALSVSSQIDSRIIIDEPGAEMLMGKGDLLARIPSHKSLLRVQSAYIDSKEIFGVCEYIKSQAGFVCDPNFEDLTLKVVSPFANGAGDFAGGMGASKPMFRDYHNDEKYEEIKKFVIATGKCSTTKLQNTFGIGFSRADGILDTLENDGIIKKEGNRRVLNDNYQSNNLGDEE